MEPKRHVYYLVLQRPICFAVSGVYIFRRGAVIPGISYLLSLSYARNPQLLQGLSATYAGVDLKCNVLGLTLPICLKRQRPFLLLDSIIDPITWYVVWRYCTYSFNALGEFSKPATQGKVTDVAWAVSGILQVAICTLNSTHNTVLTIIIAPWQYKLSSSARRQDIPMRP